MRQRDEITITVVIPAYNAARHIGRAIDSVLAQTRPPEEIIVVDDGSTDDTADVVRSFGDKVKLIQQPNAGPGAARNAGIAAARCGWIAFLDADDEWLPDKLRRQTDILRQNPELMWVSGNHDRCFCKKNYRVTLEDTEQIRRLMDGNGFFTDALVPFVQKIRGNSDTKLVNRDVFRQVGLFREDMKCAEDIDLWLRIAYWHPQLGYISEPVSIYHMDTEQSLATAPMTYSFLEAFLDRHLQLARDAGRLEPFRPYAAGTLRAWIRSAVFDDNVYDIPQALRRFGFLVSTRYRVTVTILTLWPGLTKQLFCSLSWLSRTFKLRRQTWHSKERYKRK